VTGSAGSSLSRQKALADSVPSEWVVNPEMRCFFHLVNDHEEIVDNTGIEVHDLESAKDQAQLAITELRNEIGADIDNWSGWRLDIVCSQGTLLHSMSLNNTVH
jgi:hypothetical protein